MKMRFVCILLACLHAQSLECNETNPVGKPRNYYIFVNNSCTKTVQVAIRYLQVRGNEYQTHCWWTISPYVGIYLALHEGDWIVTEDPLWFFHAEEVYGDLVWEGEDDIGTCSYRRVKMKKTNYVDSKSGDLYLDLSCSNGVVRAGHKATSLGSGPKSNSSQGDSIALRKEEIPGVEGSAPQELLP
eukprot:Skav232725  [mRNA]  locus=scaffold1843:49171:49728:- [translate_table: standard]